nr:cytochrome c-type biogenesis protein CycH [uncultured bacterium]
MFAFWASLLLAAGALLVWLALHRRQVRQQAGEDAGATVAALYQDRLEELRREMSSGRVAPEDRPVLEAELGAALLADVDGAPSAAGPDSSAPRPALLAGVSAAVLVILSVAVYLLVGDPQAMRLAGADVVFELDPVADKTALTGWRKTLEQRVGRKPDDVESWYLLGHTDLRLGAFAAAAEAFSMARQAHGGDDPSIDLFWLQARYMAADGRLDDTSREIAERVLAGNPNQPLVLEMYAIDAYQRGAYQESVSLLNRALSNRLQASHRRTLEAGFREARNRLGVTTGAVDVVIDAGAEVPSGMTLFVIARPVGGGMPFAVVRRPADSFPRTVRLDDAVSMNPALPLSAAKEFEVVVRLSRSGTAMAHPGDWEWHSQPLPAAAGDVPRQLSALLEPPV